MNKICKFTKLDLFMVKPYLKRYVLILLTVSLVIMLSTKNVYMVAYFPIFYGIIMISYPFVLSERNNIENFYGTLSINKRNIVNGRYLFAIVLILIFSLISCLLALLGSVFLKEIIDIKEFIFSISIGILFAFIVLAIQIPMFFKFGYSKAKLWTYVPFILFFVGISLIGYIPSEASMLKLITRVSNIIENNSLLFSGIFIILGLLILEVSNILSQGIYLKKEI